MGLPLYNPILNLNPGPDAPGGSGNHSGSGADSDPTTSDVSGCPDGSSNSNCYRNTRRTKHTRHSQSHQKRNRKSNNLRTAHLQRIRTPTAETHHVKPRLPWAADALEGAALARSDLKLPGDGDDCNSINIITSSSTSSSRSRSRGAGSDGRRRPPSLERQDAFRDARTVKRRRTCDSYSSESSPSYITGYSEVERGKDEEEEIAELYRMGLLYDDEYERGAGFSLDRIVREEPVYAVRTRPARRGRMGRNVGLAVDLAFSAFGEDEALAGWLLSASSTPVGRGFDMDVSPSLAVPVDTPRLTVIYELVDAAPAAADDFLDSVSDVSYGEDTWAFLDGCNGMENGGRGIPVVDAMSDDGDSDPWVVLGHDGS